MDTLGLQCRQTLRLLGFFRDRTVAWFGLQGERGRVAVSDDGNDSFHAHARDALAVDMGDRPAGSERRVLLGLLALVDRFDQRALAARPFLQVDPELLATGPVQRDFVAVSFGPDPGPGPPTAVAGLGL